MIFIFGIFIAKKSKDIVFSGIKDYFIAIAIVDLIYFHKFLMLKGFCLEYQFLQQLAIYPLVYYLLKISRSHFIMTNIMQAPYLSRIVDFLANHTLEIYMVHQTISAPILIYANAFPYQSCSIYYADILPFCNSKQNGKLYAK